MSNNIRIEEDLLGTREVPADAYYGVHTLRAIENFYISNNKISDIPEFVRGMVMVKKAAAMANKELQTIPKSVANAIIAACDEVLNNGKCKEQGVKPCRPLSTAVVSAQIAITASPISAAVVYMSSVMEGHGISYLHLLSVVIPSTLLAVLVMSFLVTMLFNSKLSDDPIYRKRLEEGLVELRGEKQIEIKSGAKTSVWLFLLGVVGVVIYAIINSPSMGLVEKPLMNTTNAILIIMLSVATLTTVICKVDTDNILNSSTFKAGMSACICILGVAWLGDTFVSNNIDWIKDTAGEVIQGHPWLLAVIFFFASALLYSQAATAKALMPMALALNVSPLTAVASFAAVSGLFILPTYPTLVAAVQMDDTGTTRIGKFVFNHPFFIPGTLGVALAVCFGFVLGSFML